jgi:two-component system sensor histidine kinase KdpD
VNRPLQPTDRILLAVVPSLVLSTIAVAILQELVGVPDASSAYLVAVVTCGLVSGTGGAILAAVGAFLVYNFLFTEPLYTFAIRDPGVLLQVVLLLFVAVVVGQLVAIQRARGQMAEAREREATALFMVSRVLATRESTQTALSQIVTLLRERTSMERVWVALGSDAGDERTTADTSGSVHGRVPVRTRVLQRMPGDEPARWVLVHRPTQAPKREQGIDTYHVRIEASGELLGSIWAERARDTGEPDRTETRLLSAAADQIGQAISRDRVADATRSAEVARQSDTLKSALLQSVSHDFRTPLAVIRAAAGGIDADEGQSMEDRKANTAAIEREVEYLNRLVANLLDLSRIEAGALRAERDVYELDDLVGIALDRVRPRLAGRTLETAVDPVPVDVDPVFLDAVLANLLENALKYTPAGARLRVSAADGAGRGATDAEVVLTVEDDGPGVPPPALPYLFDKFYRVPGTAAGSRSGLGIGLAVVRGLVEGTGGRVTARRSALGGLAVDLALPLAATPLPDDLPPPDEPSDVPLAATPPVDQQ